MSLLTSEMHASGQIADLKNELAQQGAGQPVMKSVTRLITDRLKLQGNQANSAVARSGAEEVSRI